MEKLGENMVFIVLALPRWDGQYASTSFSLSKEISKRHQVFYIDNPFTLKDVLSQFMDSRIMSRLQALVFGRNIYRDPQLAGHKLTIVTPMLVLPINWIKNKTVYNWFSRLNDLLFQRTLRRIVSDHRLQHYIYINSYNPFYGRLFPAGFKPRLFIYHTVDDISESKYVDRHGTYLEKEMVAKADFTITTSHKLKKLKEKESRKVYYLPNAADISVFYAAYHRQLPAPQDINSLKKEIIIYTGHLDQRVDTGLILQTARQYPDKTMLLVGPVSFTEKEKKTLSSQPNIVFIGSRKLTELPSYLQLAQCAIIPFKKNTLTESIYPLKINEYLAAGLPVVTTSFSEDIRAFREVAYIAESEEDFVRGIQQVISNDVEYLREQRAAAARKNTWDQRAQQLYGMILENLNKECHEPQKI